MQVIERNGVKIYNVSVGKTTPKWSTFNKQKVRVYPNNPEPGQMELIQEFAFPIFASKIRYSSDGESILASGMHPPQIKNFSTENVSVKWNRHLEAEIKDFQLLTPDASKIAILRTDRYVEFHSKAGYYYKLRMPVFGRGMIYNHSTAEVNLFGNSSDVYRLNLEHGKFFESHHTSLSNINCADINHNFGLLGVAGVDGIVECWDSRECSKSLSSLNIQPFVQSNCNSLSSSEISTLKFFPDGLTMAVGTASGYVLLYDLRSSFCQKSIDHQFDTPIQNIDYHPRSGMVISCCRKILKIWDQNSGSCFANIESPWEINDTVVLPDTGLVMMAGENPHMHIYYIPELGPPPKWASFLDNITEELTEVAGTSVYQDYKFLTHKDLEDLEITNLIGTAYLKAYMHGYFIDNRLYTRIKSIVKPDEYRNFLKQKLEEKLQASCANRIAVQRDSKVSVNNRYYEVLKKSDSEMAKSLVSDSRFQRMFNDPMMNIDCNSKTFENSTLKKSTKHKLKKLSDLPSSDTPSELLSAYEPDGICDTDTHVARMRENSNLCTQENGSLYEGLDLCDTPKIPKHSSIKFQDKINTVPQKKISKTPKLSAVQGDSLMSVVTKKVDNQINTPFAVRLENEKLYETTSDKNMHRIGPINTTFVPENELEAFTKNRVKK